jgi:hypothetical protein
MTPEFGSPRSHLPPDLALALAMLTGLCLLLLLLTGAAR